MRSTRLLQCRADIDKYLEKSIAYNAGKCVARGGDVDTAERKAGAGQHKLAGRSGHVVTASYAVEISIRFGKSQMGSFHFRFGSISKAMSATSGR